MNLDLVPLANCEYTLAKLCMVCFFQTYFHLKVFILCETYPDISMLQSCLTLVTLWTCSLSGLSALGILQARMLEWVAIPFSRGSF